MLEGSAGSFRDPISETFYEQETGAGYRSGHGSGTGDDRYHVALAGDHTTGDLAGESES